MSRKVPKQKRGRSKQDYGTPWEFVRAVERRFGKLDVDLAATNENTKASQFISPEEDSLSFDWHGTFAHRRLNLWLNPPFSHIEPWAEKCSIFGARAMFARIQFLVPASVGSNWYRAHVERKGFVLFLNGRITFVGEKDPYPKDLMLVIYGAGIWGFDTWRWME